MELSTVKHRDVLDSETHQSISATLRAHSVTFLVEVPDQTVTFPILFFGLAHNHDTSRQSSHHDDGCDRRQHDNFSLAFYRPHCYHQCICSVPSEIKDVNGGDAKK